MPARRNRVGHGSRGVSENPHATGEQVIHQPAFDLAPFGEDDFFGADAGDQGLVVLGDSVLLIGVRYRDDRGRKIPRFMFF